MISAATLGALEQEVHVKALKLRAALFTVPKNSRPKGSAAVEEPKLETLTQPPSGRGEARPPIAMKPEHAQTLVEAIARVSTTIADVEADEAPLEEEGALGSLGSTWAAEESNDEDDPEDEPSVDAEIDDPPDDRAIDEEVIVHLLHHTSLLKAGCRSVFVGRTLTGIESHLDKIAKALQKAVATGTGGIGEPSSPSRGDWYRAVDQILRDCLKNAELPKVQLTKALSADLIGIALKALTGEVADVDSIARVLRDRA